MENKHKILFSKGKLYLDGKLIAGEGIIPEKDVTFEFVIMPKTEEKKEEEKPPTSDPSVLQINVKDSVNSKDIGPGQGR